MAVNPAEVIIKHWPLIAAAATCIAVGASAKTELSTTMTRQDKLEALTTQLDGRLNRIESTVSSMATDAQRDHLDEMHSLDHLNARFDRLDGKGRPR